MRGRATRVRFERGAAVPLRELERYCAKHPGSPSAVRRPTVTRSGDMFVALLGQNLQNGIAGLGNTVEAALRMFDLQYCRALLPPNEKTRRKA